MELEYIICVTLEDGSKEEIIMWADEDYKGNELSAIAHEMVIYKFGNYSHFEAVLCED